MDVMSWLAWALISVGLLVASWMLLVVLAARLPEGSLKELAAFLPDCVTTARRLRRDSRVPRRAKVAVGFALLWVLSPIDLIPEFLPVIGPLDDVVVVALAFRYAARQVPRQVLLEAWPGKRRSSMLAGRGLGRTPTLRTASASNPASPRRCRLRSRCAASPRRRTTAVVRAPER